MDSLTENKESKEAGSPLHSSVPSSPKENTVDEEAVLATAEKVTTAQPDPAAVQTKTKKKKKSKKKKVLKFGPASPKQHWHAALDVVRAVRIMNANDEKPMTQDEVEQRKEQIQKLRRLRKMKRKIAKAKSPKAGKVGKSKKKTSKSKSKSKKPK